jgi:hypothetical protein
VRTLKSKNNAASQAQSCYCNMLGHIWLHAGRNCSDVADTNALTGCDMASGLCPSASATNGEATC